MNVPSATYRLQFSPAFGFKEAEAVLPYLARLGISHIYASPVFAARPGSAHGYDVCDHQRLNPELGGEEGFTRLRALARELGLSWIQDIVPNHMAVDGGNRMLVDLLENGEASRFHGFFDIDWDHPLESLKGRMLAPFLGGFYGHTLEHGEIGLGFDQDGFFARYWELRLPLALETYPLLLTHGLAGLRAGLGRTHTDYLKLTGVLYAIRNLSAESPRERYEQISFIKGMLWELCEASAEVRGHVDSVLAEANSGGEDGSWDFLDEVLARQRFRLSYWKVAGEEINYRRFFSINDLISLNVQKEEVFDHTHRMILSRLASGDFDGLRVDHIDGLYDPSTYLRTLRAKAGEAYIAVEKILSRDEPLPAFWPVQGTTGYDFAAAATGLLVDPAAERDFDRAYRGHAGPLPRRAQVVAAKKRRIIETHLSGDVDNLARLVKSVSSRDRDAFDITLTALRQAIAELLVAFPVYRAYLSRDSFRPADLSYIREAVRRSRQAEPLLSAEFDFLERFLLLDFPERMGQEERGQWLHIVMRFQQMTGPLMAKGLEDTAFYVLNRLPCLNEVGGDPGRFGLAVDEAHAFFSGRAKDWPATMNATATHDTKRGEDARARLAALTGLPGAWRAALKSFVRAMAPRRRTTASGTAAPTRNDEYLIMLSMLACWPWEGPRADDFPRRMQEFLQKALREGKENSGWLRPDEEYEAACREAVDALLRPGRNAFARAMQALVDSLARPAVAASLSQLALKLAAPGVPDVYQGTELWDLSFVDPDNRRPVDFDLRARMLAEMEEAFADNPEKLVRTLLARPEDGRVKLFALWRGLLARKNAPELFARGGYEPMEVEGPGAARLFAFARRLPPGDPAAGQAGSDTAIVLAPVRTGPLFGTDYPLGAPWGETRLKALDGLPEVVFNAFTGESLPLSRALLPRESLARFPAALLLGQAASAAPHQKTP
ncbi:malto-oligosyltrehalose synthase [Desulfovibrio sp. X2]|uniref:malto-oligosyltrehalose synthase n=1 Tax=Desulfovibrio sp. X2 TaxID=941449 RepID=UPI000358BA69|nr:malto-oligosyltrehalose synthase [Desulfovibrio sp. X2]EPR39839.1 malto-oligosyltrehalose synthase [Desulfovibrio sp. X2]